MFSFVLLGMFYIMSELSYCHEYLIYFMYLACKGFHIDSCKSMHMRRYSAACSCCTCNAYLCTCYHLSCSCRISSAVYLMAEVLLSAAQVLAHSQLSTSHLMMVKVETDLALDTGS